MCSFIPSCSYVFALAYALSNLIYVEALLIFVAAYVIIAPLVAIILATKARRGPSGPASTDIEDIQERLHLLQQENTLLSIRLNALESRPARAPGGEDSTSASRHDMPANIRPVGAITAPIPTPPESKTEKSVPIKTPPAQEASPPVPPEPVPSTPKPRAVPFAKDLGHLAVQDKKEQGAKEEKRHATAVFVPGMLGEVSLMKWWLPRIGGALAILAMLFYGVYVNKDMPPLPRLMEMVGLSIAMIVGGMILERRQRAYGGIVVMVGVLMCYLSSFAAYAFPPVRVISDPRLGAVIQLLVLAAIVLFGLARRSRNVVLAAFLMAWPMMLFMVYTKVGDVLLISAVLICITGALLPALHERFSIAPWIAVPMGAVAMILLTVFVDIATVHSIMAAFGYVAIIALVIPLAGAIPRWNVPNEKVLASIATALAGIATYVYFNSFFEDQLGTAFLVLAICCAIGALIQHVKTRGWSAFALMYLVKASAFASLWIITDYAGYTRWAALLVQTIAIGALGRREKRASMLATAAVTALASVGFFLSYSYSSTPPYMSIPWMLCAVFPPLLIAALAWILPARVSALDEPQQRLVFGSILAVAVPLLSLPLMLSTPCIPAHAHASMLLMGVMPLLMAWIPGIYRIALLEATGTYVVAASVMFCQKPDSLATLAALLLVCVATVLVVLRAKLSAHVTALNLTRYAAFVIAVCTSSAWLAQHFDLTNWLLAALALSGIAYVALSKIQGVNELRLFTLLAPLFILSSAFEYNWASLIAASLWLLAIPFLSSKKPNHEKLENACAIAAGLWLLMLSVDSARFITESGNYLIVLWTSLTGMALLGIARERKLTGTGLTALVIISVSLMLAFDTFTSRSLPEGARNTVEAVILCGAILPGLYLFQRKKHEWAWAGPDKIIPWAIPFINWWALAMPLASSRTVDSSWITPLLAMISCALVVFGIALRARHYRMAGLITLLLPIYRLFIYDLDDPLQRIAAFGIGGVLIMILGYLYHRLSSYMVPDNEPQANNEASSPTSETDTDNPR